MEKPESREKATWPGSIDEKISAKDITLWQAKSKAVAGIRMTSTSDPVA